MELNKHDNNSGEGQEENPYEENSKNITHSDIIDIPVSHASNIDSFHAHIVEHSEEKNSIKIESKNSVSIENNVSPEKILEESEPEEETAVLETLNLEEIADKINMTKTISDKAENLIEEIENFQRQFDKNLAIETFTDEYIKELKKYSNELEDIEIDLVRIKNRHQANKE